MKILDMRSDTTTHPTPQMRRAIFEAEVGDDGHSEDPTVNRLQQMAADMLGKEAGLLTPSGSMGNLLGVMSNSSPGDEVLLGSEAHILWFEMGGATTVAGTLLRALPNDEQGNIAVADLEAALRQNHTHSRNISMLCLENTHNRCGGAAISAENTSALADVAHKNNLKVHIDGARLFNAAVVQGVPANELTKSVDTVSICLSKGLGAPVGSVLCGSKETIEKARRWRKMIGGGMRQAGVIAAAGIVALETMIERLADDHKNAKRLAQGLSQIKGVTIDLNKVKTNMLRFAVADSALAGLLNKQLLEKGIKFGPGGNSFRVVTHWMIDDADVDYILEHTASIMKELS
ncbi:MAG: aminotransferase class I/II-fold pyridoxal phosphate-dependent enzyme [Chloroflexi bacterium]|jgi:threonine aldolase|nr:aminotransferase class I/II-fold pyridoxal phosphate-dependent enzyme [Chloroflexota bacterium]MBT7079994.1 aminotransferase class I/II-fold pyridoxal phosphate-dependent enzyme [Chloroflexota bacterium]MBT7290569.1 aminotransferase class I/II-fold pyridoxal phosphate-dependent enzyme [Chloroflexota bacterium]